MQIARCGFVDTSYGTVLTTNSAIEIAREKASCDRAKRDAAAEKLEKKERRARLAHQRSKALNLFIVLVYLGNRQSHPFSNCSVRLVGHADVSAA